MPETPPSEVTCPYDGDPAVKYGKYKGVQRYLCNTCHRKFTLNDSLFHMHHERSMVAQVLTYYFNGVSMQKVADMACDLSGKKLSKAQVWRWLVKYSELASDWASRLEPQVGSTWVADETVIKVRPQPGRRTTATDWWFWDLIDKDTRYLLSTHFTRTRTRQSAIQFLSQAQEVAGFSPDVILTDKLNIYASSPAGPGAVAQVFGAATEHHQSQGFTYDINTNLIERFHGTLKQRTKIVRHFKLPASASAILNGWIVHYNFFGRHQYLDGKSPADLAGVSDGIKNWADLLERAVPNDKLLGPVETPRGCLQRINAEEWS